MDKTLSGIDASPEVLVDEFLSEFQRSGTFLRNRISGLVELASSRDPGVAESATRALFGSLVERLADSFEPHAAALYNRVFAQIIQICRSDPRALALDRELTRFGLHTEEDMVIRTDALRPASRFLAPALEYSLKRVVVLSRVTLGADVAITSVILERLKLEFPDAELVLVGGKKTTELFGGDPRLQFKSIDYRRGGALIERLLAWIELLASVRELTNGLSGGEYLVIDPDSRLTQLGLLPVTDKLTACLSPNYLFFPSRDYGSGTSQSLAELTSAWLDEIFGEGRMTHPGVNLKQGDVDLARRLASRLRGSRSRRIIAMNFGVGENPLKRVGDEFEISLIDCLALQGNAVILDKGAGGAETARIDRVVAEATRIELDRRARATEVNEDNLLNHLTAAPFETDILVWSGRIGMLAALIGESDLYIGYDSAGQHIAAALGVPCIDVFAGSSSPRMLDRWKPTGKAETRVVPVDTVAQASAEIVTSVRQHADELLKSSR